MPYPAIRGIKVDARFADFIIAAIYLAGRISAWKVVSLHSASYGTSMSYAGCRDNVSLLAMNRWGRKMGLLEVLIVGVGTGKIWLKEDPVIAAVGDSLLDVIKGMTKETIEQRRANQQFEQIAKKVARSIKDIVDTKYPNIPENRKESIARAAGVTVDTTAFSAELLAKANLSPNELLKLFLMKSGADGGHPGLSGRGDNPAPSEERELYRVILSEAAQLIIDGASQYPNYSEAVFSELLQGQDEHVQKIDLILDEVQRIRDGRLQHTAEYRDFDEKYRRAAIRRLDELQLFGVDVASTNRRYKLSTAYWYGRDV